MGKVPPAGNARGQGWREKHSQSPGVEEQGIFQEEEQKEGPCWGTELRLGSCPEPGHARLSMLF